MPVMEIAAFVLAGGKSSRMGADKAFLELDGRTLLARAIDLARSVGPEVRILGDKARFASYAEVIEDVFPDHGPLGGIHAALCSTRSPLNLLLAVDVPFLCPEFLRFLVAEAAGTSAGVTVPHVGGRYHPLCAVYHRDFRTEAEVALRADRNRIDALFTPENTRVIREEEIAALSFPLWMFDNLNTREDFSLAQVRLAQSGAHGR